MLNFTQDFLVVILTMAASLLAILGLNRLWPSQTRRAHNELIGWQLTVLGTTYAVIVGFMLYTVWTNFGLADANASAEANSLVKVYHLAEGLPSAQRTDLRKAATTYADVVVNAEWPAMERNEGRFAATAQKEAMWRILMTVKTASPTESTAEDHAITELSHMSEHRRMRELASGSHLPGILWWVLLVGGFLTVISACMFGADNVTLHTLQVAFFSLLIALILIAIADIDQPFRGSVHVSDAAFRRAQQTMQQ
jgi:Ca2+/Na+ antiporter